MLYVATVDVWALTEEQRAMLQPGQWVQAGPDGPRGRWAGMKASGSSVVAWSHRATDPETFRALRDYALAK